MIALLLVGVWASPASAEERAYATLANDNDFWAFRGTDQDYSNALEFDVRFPMTPWLGFRRVLAGAAVGQAFFTPPDLEQTDPVALRADRPYAGWTWAAARLEGFAPGARAGAELRVGMVGPHAGGEQTQIAWHSWNRAPRPLGWPLSQVDDRAELALALWSSVEVLRFRLVGVTVEPACDVGTVRAACTLAAFARVGLLRNDRAAVPRLATPMAPPFGDAKAHRPMELFVFAGASARVVARDLLLEGDVRTGEDESIPGWCERRSLGGEVHVGVAGTYAGWSLSVAQIARTSEVRWPNAADRPQRFGRIVLGHAW